VSAAACSNRVEWARALLSRLGYPVTTANLTAVVGWELKESSLVGGAAFNPINTTQPADGATAFNTIHVKGGGVIHVWNYVSCEQGLVKTVETINNGRYDDVKAALRASADPSVLGHAQSLHVWGTGSISADVLGRARELVG